MPARCSVCDHPKRLDIDTLLVKGTSLRIIGEKHNLRAMALHRHKTNHLTESVRNAILRANSKVAIHTDKLMDRLEWLWKESAQYVEDAKSAVKPIVHEGVVVREYRDVGAMANAIASAHDNLEKLGKVTGRFASAHTSVSHSVNVAVHLPLGGRLPTITATTLPVSARLPAIEAGDVAELVEPDEDDE